jgi:hypothetical protein
MKILIIGFQRSGTTLMRRIMQGHPDIKRIFHESFFLKRFKTKPALLNFIKSSSISFKKDNWGEKVPFYPNFRKIPTLKYCEIWNEWFGKQSIILHIVRHPIDVTLSISNKYKRKNTTAPLKMYKKKMTNVIPALNKMPNVMSFKYENLLINPDDVLPKLFEFCKIQKDVDFRQYLSTIRNPKYQKFDKSRAFAHKKGKFKSPIDLTDVYQIANTIDGPEYN